MVGGNPDNVNRNSRALRALRALLRLGGEARVEPRPPPADQGPRVAPTRLSQLARHTGARRFVGSGTVDDERSVTVEAELPCRSHGVVGWQPDRATCHARVLLPRALGARVDDQRRLAG
jgi:hypothetical protein